MGNSGGYVLYGGRRRRSRGDFERDGRRIYEIGEDDGVGSFRLVVCRGIRSLRFVLRFKFDCAGTVLRYAMSSTIP